MLEALTHPATIILATLMSVGVVLFYGVFGREDLRDGNIDTLVAFCGSGLMVGVCIGFATRHIWLGLMNVLSGVFLPIVLFMVLRKIYAALTIQKK